MSLIKPAFQRCWFALALSLSVASFGSETNNKQLQESAEDIEVAEKASILVPQILQYHFQPKKQNSELSKELFEEYFKALDPQKCYFLQEDLDRFQAFSGFLIKKMKIGDNSFPLAIFEVFKARLEERVNFVHERMEKDFDLNQDIEIELDRKDARWCTSKEEMNQLWEKRLLNSYLSYEIINESLEKEQAEKAKEGKDSKELSKLMKAPKERILSLYDRLLNDAKQQTTIDTVSIFLSRFSHMYDPHSDYMNPETVEDFEIQMKNSLVGIGATLQQDEQFIKITDMVLGGPAAKDGRLKKGDYIIAVRQEGEDTPIDLVDMPLRKAIKYIRGKKNTKVYLTVMQSGETPRVVDITRDKITLEEGKAKIDFQAIPLPNAIGNKTTIKVGYLDLPSFYYECAADVLACLKKANQEGADAIILDLRMNGGGSLQDCVKIAGYFFGDGPVVQSKNYVNGQYEVTKWMDPDKKTIFGGPLLVLTDDFSASASEIVAACLQDCSRAVVMGTPKTHGKGSVQNILELNRALNRFASFFKKNPNLGSQKLTIAKFYRINGGSTQLKGVTPDITYKAYSSATASYEDELPYALAWDEISPMPFSKKIDVRPWLPILLERSNQRVSQNKEFQLYLKDVDRLEAITKQKTTSLNKAKRLIQQEEIRELTDKVFLPRVTVKKQEEDDKEVPKDLLLEEAYRVIADLAILQNGGTLPK